jgi:hypothetical protein
VPQRCGNRWETGLLPLTLASKIKEQSNHPQQQPAQSDIHKIWKMIKLVVVMTAVHLWKPR